jgi:alkylhydroperoxidase family enzyme
VREPTEQPRVPLLAVEDAKAAAEAAGVPVYFAELSVFRVLLKHHGVARALYEQLDTLLFKGRLDGRLRELVIMRIGWATGSVYEWTQHWRVARGMKITEDDLLAVRDWRSYDGFGPAERAVLAATDDTLTTGAISAATFAACRDALRDDDVLIELVAAIGCWRTFSQLLRSLAVPLEDGVDPWPPDGRSP